MRNSRAKRDHVLKAAAELFIEQGFEGTTLARLAKTSGAAIGSITHFFGDKSELAAAVLEDVARPLIVHVEVALGTQYCKFARNSDPLRGSFRVQS